MDLFKDIADIIKDDRKHSVEVKVNTDEVVVYLKYDPEHSYDSKCIIPITYTPLEEFAYIPHDEYVKIFNPLDYGIDLKEIELIKKIMEYMENHIRELNEICGKYGFDRHDYWC